MVYFIGAGPGDPELITVKGKRLIEAADINYICRFSGKQGAIKLCKAGL